MEQSSSWKEWTVRHQFDRICKLALKGEVIDYQRHLAYRQKHEVMLSELSQKELSRFFTMDEYDLETCRFQVLGYDIEVKDVLIAEALKNLTEKKRNVILLSYFMDMSDAEIAREGKYVLRADERLAKEVGESRNQIARYIRLTNLIPKILDMVDAGRIAFTIGVELSYLTEEEQYELHAVMDLEQCTPSLSQANKMKRMSQAGTLDMDEMYSILEQEKPNQREQIKIRADTLADYFPKDFTPRQKVELIESLVKEWYEKQMVQAKPSVQQKLKKTSRER